MYLRLRIDFLVIYTNKNEVTSQYFPVYVAELNQSLSMGKLREEGEIKVELLNLL